MNCHLALTDAVTASWPGSTATLASADITSALRIMNGRGGPGEYVSDALISMSCPKLPPAALAIASASARDFVTAIFDSQCRLVAQTAYIPVLMGALPYALRSIARTFTDDIDDARVYGGIHFRFDQEIGGRLGTGIASYIYRHNLRRVKHWDHDDDCRDEHDNGRGWDRD